MTESIPPPIPLEEQETGKVGNLGSKTSSSSVKSKIGGTGGGKANWAKAFDKVQEQKAANDPSVPSLFQNAILSPRQTRKGQSFSVSSTTPRTPQKGGITQSFNSTAGKGRDNWAKAFNKFQQQKSPSQNTEVPAAFRSSISLPRGRTPYDQGRKSASLSPGPLRSSYRRSVQPQQQSLNASNHNYVPTTTTMDDSTHKRNFVSGKARLSLLRGQSVDTGTTDYNTATTKDYPAIQRPAPLSRSSHNSRSTSLGTLPTDDPLSGSSFHGDPRSSTGRSTSISVIPPSLSDEHDEFLSASQHQKKERISLNLLPPRNYDLSDLLKDADTEDDPPPPPPSTATDGGDVTLTPAQSAKRKFLSGKKRLKTLMAASDAFRSPTIAKLKKTPQPDMEVTKRSFVSGKARLELLKSESHEGDESLDYDPEHSGHPEELTPAQSAKRKFLSGKKRLDMILAMQKGMKSPGTSARSEEDATEPAPETPAESARRKFASGKKRLNLVMGALGNMSPSATSKTPPKEIRQSVQGPMVMMPTKDYDFEDYFQTPEELELVRQKSAELSHLNTIIGSLRTVTPKGSTTSARIKRQNSMDNLLITEEDLNDIENEMESVDGKDKVEVEEEEEEQKDDAKEEDNADQMARDILQMLRNLKKVDRSEIEKSSGHSVSTLSTAKTITDQDGRDLLQIISDLRIVGALQKSTNQLTAEELKDLDRAVELLDKAYETLNRDDYPAKRMKVAVKKLKTLLEAARPPKRRSFNEKRKDKEDLSKQHPYEIMDDALQILEQDVINAPEVLAIEEIEEDLLDAISNIQLMALGVLEREEDELADLIRGLRPVPKETEAVVGMTKKKRLSLIDDFDVAAIFDSDSDVGPDEDEEIDELAVVLSELRQLGKLKKEEQLKDMDDSEHSEHSQHSLQSHHSLSSLSKHDSDFLAGALRRLNKCDMTEQQSNLVSNLIRGMRTDHDETTDAEDLHGNLSKFMPFQPDKVKEIASVLKSLRRMDGMDDPEQREEIAEVVAGLGRALETELGEEDMEQLDNSLHRFRQVSLTPDQSEQVADVIGHSWKMRQLKDENGAPGDGSTVETQERIDKLHDDMIAGGSSHVVADESSHFLKTVTPLPLNEDEANDLANAVVDIGEDPPSSIKELNDDFADALRRLIKVDMDPDQAQEVARVIYQLRRLEDGSPWLTEEESDEFIDNLRNALDTPRQFNEVKKILKGLRQLDMFEDDAKELANRLCAAKGAKPVSFDDSMDDAIRRLRLAEMTPDEAQELADIFYDLYNSRQHPDGYIDMDMDIEPYRKKVRDALSKKKVRFAMDFVESANAIQEQHPEEEPEKLAQDAVREVRDDAMTDDEAAELAEIFYEMYNSRLHPDGYIDWDMDIEPYKKKVRDALSRKKVRFAMDAMDSFNKIQEDNPEVVPEELSEIVADLGSADAVEEELPKNERRRQEILESMPDLADDLQDFLRRLRKVELTPKQARDVSTVVYQLRRTPDGEPWMEDEYSDELINDLRKVLDNPRQANEVLKTLKGLRRMDMDDEQAKNIANRLRLENGADPMTFEDELADIISKLKRADLTPAQAAEAAKIIANLRKAHPRGWKKEDMEPYRHQLRKVLPEKKLRLAEDALNALNKAQGDHDEEIPEDLADRVAGLGNEEARDEDADLEPPLKNELDGILNRLKKVVMTPKQAEAVSNVVHQLRSIPGGGGPLLDEDESNDLIGQLSDLFKDPPEAAKEIMDALRGLRHVDMDPDEARDMANSLRLAKGAEPLSLEDELDDIIRNLRRVKMNPKQAKEVGRIIANLRKTKFRDKDMSELEPFRVQLRKVLPEDKVPFALEALDTLSLIQQEHPDEFPVDMEEAITEMGNEQHVPDDASKTTMSTGSFGDEAPKPKSKKKKKKKTKEKKEKAKAEKPDEKKSKKKYDWDKFRKSAGGGDKHFHHKGKAYAQAPKEEEEEEEFDEFGKKIVFANRHHWKHKKHFHSVLGDKRYRASIGWDADQILYSPLSRDQYRRRKTVGDALFKAMDKFSVDDSTDDIGKVEKEQKEKEERIFEAEKKIQIVVEKVAKRKSKT